LQERQHLRQLRLVVLQVGIHHRRTGRAGCQDALDACAGEPSPADPANAADAAILPRQGTHHVPGPVRGIVIDEDDFPGDARQRCLQLAKQLGDVVALVEGGNDDRKLEQAWSLLTQGRLTRGLLRGFGARSDGFIHERKRISAASGDAKPQFPRKVVEVREYPPKPAGKRSKNANDHEQQARVHPAQPSYSVVVPAPELSSVNVAVGR